jgi:hypothetical protein
VFGLEVAEQAADYFTAAEQSNRTDVTQLSPIVTQS